MQSLFLSTAPYKHHHSLPRASYKALAALSNSQFDPQCKAPSPHAVGTGAFPPKRSMQSLRAGMSNHTQSLVDIPWLETLQLQADYHPYRCKQSLQTYMSENTARILPHASGSYIRPLGQLCPSVTKKVFVLVYESRPYSPMERPVVTHCRCGRLSLPSASNIACARICAKTPCAAWQDASRPHMAGATSMQALQQKPRSWHAIIARVV